MKQKINFTIDEDIIDWIKSFGNASEKANEIFRKAKIEQADLFTEMEKIEKEQQEINEKKKAFFEKLEKIYEEADKKSREEAEKLKQKLREKDEQKTKEIDTLVNVLKETGFFEELLSLKNIDELFAFNKKLIQLGVKNPFSKLGNFGILCLREIAEFNNYFIPLNNPEKKEESKEVEQ